MLLTLLHTNLRLTLAIAAIGHLLSVCIAVRTWPTQWSPRTSEAMVGIDYLNTNWWHAKYIRKPVTCPRNCPGRVDFEWFMRVPTKGDNLLILYGGKHLKTKYQTDEGKAVTPFIPGTCNSRRSRSSTLWPRNCKFRTTSLHAFIPRPRRDHESCGTDACCMTNNSSRLSGSGLLAPSHVIPQRRCCAFV